MTLEISYENNIIYKTEFYQSVIIPNIIFKGIKTPIINNDIGFGYDKKIKKDKKLEPLIPKDYGNDNIPYSIVCFADSPHNPIVKDPFSNNNKNITKNDTLEWTIRFFSSDSLVISKNMCKETKEKSLRELWEKEPTRSIKAKNSRYNYLIENKINKIIRNTTKNFNPKDAFKINLKLDLNLNSEELKFLDYFKQAEGSKEKLINLQSEDLLNNGNANSQYAASVFSDKEKEKDKEKENKLSEYRKLGRLTKDKDSENKNHLGDDKETSEKNEINTNINQRDPLRDYEENLNFYKNFKYVKYTQENSTNFYSPEKTKSKLIENFINYVEEDRMKIIKNNIVKKSDKYNTRSK